MREVVYNLRYAGQYFDTETGLNYNYRRDYDPQTGRYVESDPIGLKGGINTYAYVGSMPTISVDPRGLVSGPDEARAMALYNPPSDSGSCPKCQGADRWSYTPPAPCSSGDVMCGIAMQAAGIPGPYYSTTHVVSRKCVLGLLALAKPAGYLISGQLGRQIALGTALEYPAIAEAALGLTGPWSAVIAAPYAMDEIVKTCACGN